MRFPSAFLLCPFLSVCPLVNGIPASPDYEHALQVSGWGDLANIAARLNASQLGQQLLADLTSGQSFTVFAPTNEAIQAFSSRFANDNTFAEVISYHFLPGDFRNTSSTGSGGGTSTTTSESTSTTDYSTTTTPTATSTDFSSPSATGALFARLFGLWRRQNFGGDSGVAPQILSGIWPTDTVGRTLLSASNLVSLEGGKNQVLAWTRSSETGNVTILNQIVRPWQNITIVDSSTLRNLFVNRINGVLIPPGSLSTALTAVNATAARTVLSSVQVPSYDGADTSALDALEGASGITVFVPNNQAFTSEINQTVQGLQGSQSDLVALIQNHYINGTTLYAPNIAATTETVISAAGEPFQFTTNDTGTYVNIADSSVARIVRPDVLLRNGVAHIIDQVLTYTGSNPAAASSAFDSATSAATASTTETAPITAPFGGPTSTDYTSTTATYTGTSTTS